MYQMNRILLKLPLAFITRCRAFSEYCSKLKAYYSIDSNSLADLVFLLSKLKFFDRGKAMFDAEVDICESLYSLIMEYLPSDSSLEGNGAEGEGGAHGSVASSQQPAPTITGAATTSRRASFLSRRLTSTGQNILDKHRQNVMHDYSQYTKDRDQLWELIGRSRMFVLSHLVQIGAQVRQEINALHLEINSLTTKVAQADLTKIANVVPPSSSSTLSSPESPPGGAGGGKGGSGVIGRSTSPNLNELKTKSKTILQRYDRGALSDTYSILRELGGAINVLRQKITTNIRAQQLIHEGNDIVGSAIIGLEESDMDDFLDMDLLEDLFCSKYRACTTIVEINDVVRSVTTVRLGTCDVSNIFKIYSSSLETLKFLESKKGNETTTQLLSGLLESLRPVLELAACLKSDSMKLRHWNSMNQHVFEPCQLELSFDGGGESIDHIQVKAIGDDDTSRDPDQHANTVTGRPTSLPRLHSTTSTFHDGTFRSISLQSIFEKGIGNHLSSIQTITANACVENMIEKLLLAIHKTMKSCSVKLSLAWIDEDTSISNKMFFQFHHVVNCIQLKVLLQYCLRALNVIEHTAIDMKLLPIFHKSIEYLLNVLTDMFLFISNLELIQHQWLLAFHYVKYSPQGELDRETERLYQITTEEIKRIDILLQNSASSSSGGDGTSRPGTSHLRQKTSSPSSSSSPPVSQLSSSLFHSLNLSYEQSISTNLPLTNLINIIEDVNTSTQSMLDAYPRLSLLPYHRTKKLIKVWNIGIGSSFRHEYLEYLTQCIHELFNGVGKLEMFLGDNTSGGGGGGSGSGDTSGETGSSSSQKCYGVISNDLCEKILFNEVLILSSLTLDQFLKKFEYQLRLVLSRSCDMIIIQYIQLLKDMTGDLSLDIIFDNIREIFRVRMNLIFSSHQIQRQKHSNSNRTPHNKTSHKHSATHNSGGGGPSGNGSGGNSSSSSKDNDFNDKPNQSIILVNRSLFAENLWLCLGYPIGSIAIARPDISTLKSQLSSQWRLMIRYFIEECHENLISLQNVIITNSSSSSAGAGGTNGVTMKYLNLCSTLLQLEISFINLLEELLLCPSLESATELWISKYQLRYLYDKYERYQNSPFDITIGCVSIPYGMEYQGGTVVALTGYHLENAIHKVIGSSYMSKGTVFISHDTTLQQPNGTGGAGRGTSNSSSVVHQAVGECVVSPRDVATALGRLHTTISSLCTENNVKLFLSRLLYLDAVGSIDMTTIDHTSLQMLLTTLGDMWLALERKDDYFMVGALKYPLYTRLSSNPLHMTRKKNNMTDLRDHLKARGKDFFGLFVIGIITSESGGGGGGSGGATGNIDDTILDYLYSKSSSFNIVSVTHSRPVDEFGLMLCGEGYKYGMLLQLIFQDILKELYQKLQYQLSGVGTSSTGTTSVSYLSSTLLIRTIVRQCKVSIIQGKYSLARLYGESGVPDNKILRLEMECFYSVLLDQLMKLGHCSHEDFDEVHALVRSVIQVHLTNVIVDPENRFDMKIPSAHEIISDRTRRILTKSMEQLGYAHGSMFLEQCSILWKLMTTANPIIILSGPPGSGKTAIRSCVIDGIRREGYDTETEFSNVSALQHWRSAKILSRAVKKWLSLRKTIPEKKISRPPEHDKPANHTSSSSRRVPTTVIHHTSLTLEHFLGSFDDSGRWQDGLLLRKLRATDEVAEKAHHSKERLSQVLVLQGPLGSHLEQLLSVTQYSNHANVTSIASDTHRVSFPSGEMCVLDPSVTILLETADVTLASPAFLMQIPQVNCGVSPDHCAKRLLAVWFESLTAWLRQFPPWKDLLSELNHLLLKSDFIREMLRCDMTTSEMNSITALTRTSTFLRYLEQLIQQIHELTLEESSWQSESLLQKKKNRQSLNHPTSSNPFDRRESSIFGNEPSVFSAMGGGIDEEDLDLDEEEEEEYERRRATAIRFPPLTAKEKEKMNYRLKLALAYSSVWGFGGGVNGTKRRMFFDLLARQSIETYLSSSLYLPYECSLFEISLDLKECCFIHSLTTTKLLPKIIPTDVSPGAGSSLGSNGGSAAIEVNVRTKITSDAAWNLPKIQFLTGSNCAVRSALALLLQSGANVLMTGLSGSGKSTLLSETLESIGKSCPSPQTMREDIMKRLLEIVGDGVIPDGIPAVLHLLEKIIQDLDKLPLIPDSIATESLIWQQIQDKIREVSVTKTGGAADHFQKQTIFSYSTSLKSHSTASSFRNWLLREMRSETDGVLEPPRGTYGLIFIDDAHLCCDVENFDDYFKVIKETNRVVCDRVDGLVRGLVEESPSFGLLRNLNKSHHSLTSKMPTHHTVTDHQRQGDDDPKLPTLHKEFYTQPTRPLPPKEENYFINQLGVLLCATGDIKSLQRSLSFASLMTHFCVIGIPLLSDDEIRSFLIHGVKESIFAGYTTSSSASSGGGDQHPLSDLLTKHLRDLTSLTLSITENIKRNENIYTPLEKSILKNTIPQMTMIQRLCCSFYSGSKSLRTTSNLLHLWSHEWKRNVMDPLPYGGLKQRYQWAWREKMNRMDVVSWNISPRWLQAYMDEFNQNSDAIWMNGNLLTTSASQTPPPSPPRPSQESQLSESFGAPTEAATLELDYSPLRFDLSTFDQIYNPHYYHPPTDSSVGAAAGATEATTKPVAATVTELHIPDSTGMNNLRSVMYPHAMSNILRMLRIMNSTTLNILLLSGVGSCIRTGLKIVAALSSYSLHFFDCCNRPISLSNGLSEDLRISFDIQRFLKNILLEAAGFQCSPDASNSRTGVFVYQKIIPKKILAVLFSSQLLSLHDRKLLLCVMNMSDPSSLFTDAEILGKL
jgi:hypothetical protein